jgi:hypothetical protein
MEQCGDPAPARPFVLANNNNHVRDPAYDKSLSSPDDTNEIARKFV